MEKLDVDKGIIYYSHNNIDDNIAKPVQKSIEDSGLPIVSVTLKPIDLGENIVLDREPGVITMFTQILTALEALKTEYVFFCEHDVLYHPSHFDFVPPDDDVYYYNTNVWRWDFPKDRLIRYDELKSLSGMCCNRYLALKHYRTRLKLIKDKELEEGRDPKWARIMGYEPGKPKKKGGLMDEKVKTWESEFPLIDIRHNLTLTPPKVTLSSFRKAPTNWREITINQLKGWNLKTL